MSLTVDFLNELELLNLFNLDTLQGGIKIHHDADENKIRAAKCLFTKGIITQRDGGYLTARGRETAQHVQALLKLLQVK